MVSNRAVLNGEERGGGPGTQKFVYQKWPDKIFPILNFVFSHDGHFGLEGGGGVLGGGGWHKALVVGSVSLRGAYWPLAFQPSAMTSRHPYYCGHPHCRGQCGCPRQCWEGGGVMTLLLMGKKMKHRPGLQIPDQAIQNNQIVMRLGTFLFQDSVDRSA